MPVLIITPLITADTCEGAAGWASGSQTCIGMKPALVPKPITANRKRTPPGAAAVESRSKSKRRRIRAQQQEQRQQKGRAQVHGHQVDPTGPADALFFVFQRHEEERCQRHEFPTREEQHAVAGHDDQQHAGGQQIEEEPRDAEILPAGVAFGDTRSHRRPPTSSPVQSPRRRPPKARRFPCWPNQTATATPAAGIATGRKRARPATGTRPLPPPSSAPAAPIRHAPFGLLPTASESRPPANKIANAIRNQTMRYLRNALPAGECSDRRIGWRQGSLRASPAGR